MDARVNTSEEHTPAEENKPPAAQAEGSWKAQGRFPLPLYLVPTSLNLEFCVQLCFSGPDTLECSVEGHCDGQEHKDLLGGCKDDRDPFWSCTITVRQEVQSN